VKYLTVEEVYLLHERLIQRIGGSSGLRDPDLLASAVARPQASFGGEELYPDLWTKAAALMHSLIKNHPFVDGNKRTAVTATGIFLELNGHRLTASNEEMVRFAVQLAAEDAELVEIAAWVQSHASTG
jgi:death-on-curing protein